MKSMLGVKITGLICLLLLISIACDRQGDNASIPKEKTNSQTSSTKVFAPAYDSSLPGEDGMKNCIRGYSQAVIDAKLSDKHVRFIRKFATEQASKRALIFINEDREKGQAMSTRLNKLVFDNISVSANSNFVDTSEHWDFQRLYIETSKPVEPVASMRYKLRYHLDTEDGRWVISKIEELEPAKAGEYTPPRWKM